MNFFKKSNFTKQCIGAYSVIFALLCLTVYSSFIIFGKSFIWSIGTSDGLTQHLPSLTYIGVWGREIIRNFLKGDFTVPVWNFSIGYGGDAITTFHYYGLGDPLSLLSILVPVKYTEYLYDFLIILRLYLSGLCFIFYCKKMKQDLRISVLGALIYIFCGYSLCAGIRHPFFLTPMIYFPLVLIGCEKIFKKENPLLFISSVALCTLSNFYFAYMLIILTVIYVTIRFIYMNHQNFKKEMFSLLFKFFGFGAIGLMISAILLLPIFIVFMGNSRSDVSNSVPILYNLNYYENLFCGFSGYQHIGYWNFSGYTPLSLIAVFFIFIKKSQYKPLKTAFIVSLVLQIFPIFAHILNGLAYVSNRYIWAVAFLVAFIAVYTLKDIINSSRQEKIKLLIISCVYTLIFFVLRHGKNISTVAQLIFLFAILLVLIGAEFLFNRNVLKLSYITLAIITVFSICANGIFCNSPNFSNYIADFHDANMALNDSENTISNKFKNQIKFTETSFSRYETNTTERNRGLLNNTASLSYYFSFSNDKTIPFLLDMQVPIVMNFCYDNLDRRIFLETLTSTKHYITNNNKFVPYNFEYIKKKNLKNTTFRLYENPSALPLGYTYNGYISKENFEKLSVTEKQEVLMQNVLLETLPSGFTESNYTLTSKEFPLEISYDKNIKKTKNGIYVKKDKSLMRLEFKGIGNCETYLSIKNLHGKYLDEYELQKAIPNEYKEEQSKYTQRLNMYNHLFKNDETVLNIEVNAKNTSSLIRLRTPEYSFYSGVHDFTTNLGYSKQAQNSCTLTFPKKGFYSWDDIKIICQPMDNYQSYTENLSRDVLENLNIEDNRVSGKISLQEDKILCLSIPYSDGWKCYVNGKETELLQANIWSMAIPLSAGEYDIRLEYSTPGLKLGAILTAIGILLTIGITIYYIKRKKYEQIN